MSVKYFLKYGITLLVNFSAETEIY